MYRNDESVIIETTCAVWYCVCVGTHGVYFRRRKFKPQVIEKVSTLRNVASVKWKNY